MAEEHQSTVVKWGFGMAPLKEQTDYRNRKALVQVSDFVQGKMISGKAPILDQISVVKGLFNRVMRQDQWDWFTINMYFDYKFLTANPGQITFNVVYLAKMFSHNAAHFLRLSNKFTYWSYEDCSLEGFDSIIEEMRHYILDNEDVAERLIGGPPIGRNELCPCGSGKKYKKCHGFWTN